MMLLDQTIIDRYKTYNTASSAFHMTLIRDLGISISKALCGVAIYPNLIDGETYLAGYEMKLQGDSIANFKRLTTDGLYTQDVVDGDFYQEGSLDTGIPASDSDMSNETLKIWVAMGNNNIFRLGVSRQSIIDRKSYNVTVTHPDGSVDTFEYLSGNPAVLRLPVAKLTGTMVFSGWEVPNSRVLLQAGDLLTITDSIAITANYIL
jgi:hypothetical protein